MGSKKGDRLLRQQKNKCQGFLERGIRPGKGKETFRWLITLREGKSMDEGEIF